MIRVGRFLTPRLRTRDERPIPFREFRQFSENFPQANLTTFFLTTPLAYLFRISPKGEKLFCRAHRFLRRVDGWLFRTFPFLQNLAWYAILKAEM